MTIIQAPVWWVLMFISTYSTRRVLTQFFVTQTDAEKTRDVLTAILDNLPDAVLISDEGKLSYCNQQADSFFGVSLSQLNALGDGGETFRMSQYQIMNNRCFHELKTSGVDQVAEKMMMTDDGSVSIVMTELGQSILTLTEVLQTFELESTMYNIKLPKTMLNIEFRTVVLRKTQVEIDGKKKVLIMINDVSDKVRLEQEQIKKKK